MLKLIRRLSYWIRHRRASRDLTEEMEFHRAQRQRDFERSGLAPLEAARASRRALGNTLLAEEDARGVWIWPSLEQLWQDLVFGGRILLRNPGFSAAAVLTLALGIGANTAVFSVVKGVLLSSLSYRSPDRLVMMWERNLAVGKDRDPVAPLNYLDWKKDDAVFETIGAYRFDGFVLTGAGEPEQIGTLTVSASLFDALGVEAAIGRVFTEEEERKKDRVVVLSHAFWQRRFGGDRSLIGKHLNLDTNSYVVLGVMPPQFRFPDNVSPVETYSPLLLGQGDFQGDLSSRTSHTLTVVARLKDGITVEKAATHMNEVARNITAKYSDSNPEVAISGMHEVFAENIRLGLLVTFGAVSFLMLIACANVANLKLAHGFARAREIAVRASLGASRWRIIRQLVTENLLLSILGGVMGLILARWMIVLFVDFSPNLFGIQNVTLDMTILAFTLVVSMLTGVAFGLAPAWQISRANLNATIKVAAPNGRQHVAQSALVIAEVTLSVLLAISAGLMVRGFLKLSELDYGFRPENLFTMQLFVAQAKYPADTTQFRPRQPGTAPRQLSPQARLYNDLVDRLKAEPGIQGAAAVSALPLSPDGIDFDLPVYVEGQPRPRADETPQADFRIATSDYFQTMGMRMIEGRGFTDDDTLNTPDVVVINETMARRFFGGESPVGKRIIFYGIPREIVGVVASVRHRGFRVEPNPEMIVPSKQFQQFGGMTIVVRSFADPGTLENIIKRELRRIDPDLPASNARTMEGFLGDSVAQFHLTTWLLASFALLGIGLAGVGIYGVVAYGVTQRTHEIGIRMTLGAERRVVVAMFVKETLALTAIGLVCGVGAAIGATRLMRGLLFGVAPSDPATYVVSAGVLIVAAMAASYWPALRATRVDPLRAVKHD